MKNWGKEDRAAWDNSEVAKNFEANTLSNLLKLEKLAQSINTKQVETVKSLSTELDKANSSAKELSKTLGSSADDGCDNVSDSSEEIKNENQISDDEYPASKIAEAKEQILHQLRKMAEEAIERSDIVSAYKIERTIAEVEEVDV